MDPTEEPGFEPEAVATPLSEALGGSSEPQPEPAPAPVAEPAPVAKADDPQGPFWYRKRLQEVERRAKDAERRAEELAQRQAPPQQDAPQYDFNDPSQVQHYIAASLERQALVGRLERSEERFSDKHGAEAFEETREWLATRPDIEEWALKQRDPWAAAHQQYTREKLSSEIGDDPEKWRASERARMEAEIRAQYEGQPAPAAPQMRPNLPRAGASVPSAAPRDNSGRFTGPTPLGSALKNG